MNHNFKKIFLGALATSILICGLAACNDKEVIKDNHNSGVSSGSYQEEDNNTYNNGGYFVQYKGNTYYREYSNSDVEKVAIEANYSYDTGVLSTKYINSISKNGKVENVFEDDGFGKIYILDDKFYLSGYNNKIYSVDMNGENYIEYCKGEYVGIDEGKHKVYYENYNNGNAMYVINTKNSKITKLNEDEAAEVKKAMNMSSNNENKVYDASEGYTYYTGLEKNLVIFSSEIESFKERYGISSGDSSYGITISNLEVVGNKIYYLLELSENNLSEMNYKRIASEVYMFDVINGKKTLLYLYKITDEERQNGGVHDAENVEEPLAENEMYLEIKLADKGLKETFEVRVEEVGGSVIGKKVEYEGTHSRKEGVLKIKVMKEVGAMLTVYIDDEIDSQMLIEE